MRNNISNKIMNYKDNKSVENYTHTFMATRIKPIQESNSKPIKVNSLLRKIKNLKKCKLRESS